jgi:LacI family transcriptional regulator
MVDKLTSPYAMEVLRGVSLMAEKHAVDIVVGRFRRDLPDGGIESNSAWTHRLLAARRVGAIIMTANVDAATYKTITQARLPVVVIDPLNLTDPDIVSIGSTNWTGGRVAAEHLIGLGHTRLAMIGGPAVSISAVARVEGFRSACDAARISVGPNFVRHTRFDHDSAQQIAQEWFTLESPPTAIVASSDAQAMGVLEAARLTGLQVPLDVSLVGYDDTYVASWANPPLTCVRQPLQDIGRVALRTVLQLHNQQTLDSNHIELATTLVVRESTAPPRPCAGEKAKA